MEKAYAESVKKKEKLAMFDERSGLADMLASLIEKYASDLDIGDMPDTAINTENKVDKSEED